MGRLAGEEDGVLGAVALEVRGLDAVLAVQSAETALGGELEAGVAGSGVGVGIEHEEEGSGMVRVVEERM